MRLLVTGATGYIGGRLIPELLDRGHQVRVLARHPERLSERAWADRVEIFAGDATDPEALRRAMTGMQGAHYLMHSLSTGHGFEDQERTMATVFAEAAEQAGVQRIVYLGGMVPDIPQRKLSAHLRSRAEVGRILRASSVPTIELRAGVIIGSGSASFEMLRYLTERLPVMITPRWVKTRTQPIAVRDVLHYLIGAMEYDGEVNRAYDIGGPDVTTYAGMMHGFASVAGLPRRVLLPVNVLSPGLSAHWVGLVTPVPNSIARPLVDSLKVEVVARDHDIADIVPDPPAGLLSFREAVRLAIKRIQDADVATRWSSASVAGAPSDPLPEDPDWAGGSLYTDVRERVVAADITRVWDVVEGIGGEHGWYSANWMWRIRGLADRAVGGVGLRRGRRDPNRTQVGDALDFWRVEAHQPPSLLRLRAEMKVPGLAWIEWRLTADGVHRTHLRQRAVFFPRGLAGHAYWWAVAPFHAFVFPPMIRGMAEEAEALPRATEPVEAHPVG
ncbi:MAG: SDR family oxidoreductase [Micrococcales bacterium]|nr:SDR family oxidoreductase [Micrococcales bacterium]